MDPNDFALSAGKTFPWHEVYGNGTTEEIVKFYTSTLDWETTVMPMEGGNYTMLIANGNGVAGVLGNDFPGMENTPPHWATYIAVDDVDARLAKAVAAGAKNVHGPLDVPTVGRMTLIQDPFGAHVWLFTPAPMPS